MDNDNVHDLPQSTNHVCAECQSSCRREGSGLGYAGELCVRIVQRSGQIGVMRGLETLGVGGPVHGAVYFIAGDM